MVLQILKRETRAFSALEHLLVLLWCISNEPAPLGVKPRRDNKSKKVVYFLGFLFISTITMKTTLMLAVGGWRGIEQTSGKPGWVSEVNAVAAAGLLQRRQSNR